jgi:peptide/nickel transport system substrate-binding protein
MKKLRWQLLIVLLALVAITVLLLGRQPVIQAVVPEPATGGVYTEGLVGAMGRLNPVHDAYNSADRDVNRLLYSSLVRFDSRGLPNPELAESWGISRDGTVYNFSLRPEIFWHDGEPLTAFDIAFTIELLRDPASPLAEDQREFWEQIEVKPLNEETIQFVLPEPFAPFLDYLSFGVLPEHLVGELGPDELSDSEFNLQPVGSGPYRFDRFIVEGGAVVGVVLSAFDDYFTGRPFIDQFVFRYYPDSASALAAYRDGEVLGISRITPDVLGPTLAEPGLNVYSSRLPEFNLIYLNLDHPDAPFLQEVQVRQALVTGLNRQRMIDRLRDGQAIVAAGPIFPGTWASYDDLPVVAFEPDLAVDQLIEAGYTIPAAGGEVRRGESGPLRLELVHEDEPAAAALAESIQRDWTRLGVGVTLLPVPIESLVADYLETGEYQAALVSLNFYRTPDPDPYVFWHEAQVTGGQNYARWDNRQASEYLEQARVTLDLAERARLYRNFQVIFARELPSIPLFYPVYSFAVDQEVQGVTVGPLFDPSDRFASVEEWFLLARRTVEEIVTPTATP